MVDALNAPRHLDLERETDVMPHVGELGFKETPAAADAHDAPDPNEVAEQIAFADLLLMNKCDLVEPEQLEALERRVRGLNPFAEMMRCTHSEVPLPQRCALLSSRG